MAIRISGLISGMDTDSMVQELVKAYATKKDKYVKSQKKLEWKMDAWKDLNTKVNSFYKKLGILKFSTGYSKKSTTCSDPTKAVVTAGNNAINGTQSLKINHLASAAFISGEQLGSSVTNETTLKELGLTGDGTIAVKTKDGTKNITVKENMKIKDFTAALSGAGVSANFDASNHRLYISAKESGLENDFALTATDAMGMSVLQSLGVYTKTDANTAAYKQWTDYAVYNSDGTINQADTEAKLTDILDTINTNNSDITSLQEDSVRRRTENTNYLADTNYANNYYELSEYMKYGTPIKDADGNTTGYTPNLTSQEQSDLKDLLTKQGELTADEITRRDELKVKLVGTDADAEGHWNAIGGYASAVKEYEKEPANAAKVSEVKADYITDGQSGIQNYVDAVANKIKDNNDQMNANSADIAQKSTYNSSHALLTNAAPPNDTLTTADRVSMLMDKIQFADREQKFPSSYSGAGVVEAQDAEIVLNKVTYKSSSNNFNINGMSITALQETKGEELTITTQENVQGMFDTVKGLLTEYNNLIKEMDTLYNAKSAKGYEPLTDDERKEMSDKEVEEWDKKIKDSILRRDDRLSTVINLMSTTMNRSYTLSDGKKYSLSSFGIKTAGYLNAKVNEDHLFHIDGDPDDELVSDKSKQLLSAIQEKPEMVQEFFQTLSADLYKELDGKMKTSNDAHSVFTIYSDKTMQKEYDDYTKTIKKWEQKLADMEDFYYKKFSAMETALSKLQQSSSALSGLLGSGS